MSGPALRQREAHRAIHEAAREEALVVLSSIRRLLSSRDPTRARGAAHLFVEVYEAKVSLHLKAEELDLYPDLRREGVVGEGPLAQLLLEHEALRTLSALVARQIEPAPTRSTAALMTALMVATSGHSAHEESVLFSNRSAFHGLEPRSPRAIQVPVDPEGGPSHGSVRSDAPRG